MRNLALLAAAVLVAGCADVITSPTTRAFAAVSINSGTTIPLTHYCTPASSSTEQWVTAGPATLTLYGDGTFQLNAAEGTGSAQYHMNGTTKVYDIQTATGGTNGVAGSSVGTGDGVRTLRFERATSIYADPTAYTGRVYTDSAVITRVMKCDHPTAPDSSYTFTIVLK